MEPSIANKDEAEKCRDLAKNFLHKGEYEKAIKFFDKSLRLFPLPGVTALKEKAQKLKDQPSGSSSSSRPSASATSGSSSPKPAESTRSFTEEQESGSKEIIRLSKISHYKVLSVEKSDSDVIIKKAYRKLALKFHPDKNSAPSAEGAFKAINAAFDCLSDPSKRREYDMVGHDSFEGTGSSSPYSGFRQRSQGHSQDISPEDLFNMFFSGGNPQFRRRQAQQQYYRKTRTEAPRGRAPQEEETKVGFQFLIQLLPILFMLLLSFTSMSSGSNLPNATFSKKGRFQHRHQAEIFVPVSKQYAKFDVFLERPFNNYRFTDYEKKKFDEKILSDYRQDLQYKCKEEEFWERKNSRNKSKNLTKPASIDGTCQKMRSLFSRKPNPLK